jgi:hypothetical protein
VSEWSPWEPDGEAKTRGRRVRRSVEGTPLVARPLTENSEGGAAAKRPILPPKSLMVLVPERNPDMVDSGNRKYRAQSSRVRRTEEDFTMATLAAATAPAKSHKGLWLTVAGVVILVVAVTFMLPNTPNLAAGLSLRELIAIEAILFLSGLMSGLSGFGFSAVGASTLLFIAPTTQAPLLQTLSTGNQLLSVEQLRADMPKSWEGFWAGPGFCILGGLPGAYVGIWMLSHLPAKQLMTVFGSFLVLYCVYSLFKPVGTKIHGFDGPIT